MELSGREVAIVGLGRSGEAAARLCLARGAQVTLFDEAPVDQVQEKAESLLSAGAILSEGEPAGGELPGDALEGFELVVVSPGVPPRKAIERAEQTGAEVIGELELASRLVRAPIALIGGTNGKSTVTAWSVEMLQAAGKRVFIGGNFGTPLSDAVDQSYDALVVEISSFQAERLPTLHARVCALLNVSEDHLDRYPSFEAYAHAKGNPFAAMTSEDVAVVPFGDAVCAAQARRGGAQLVTFGTASEADVYATDEAIIDRIGGGAHPLSRLRVRGGHNVLNACAAMAVAGALGADIAAIGKALASFDGLDHRNELVAEIDGVRFYNDSKATNVGAVVAALAGMQEERAVLIAGGRDKQGDYAPMVEALRARGRALVLIGEAAERIAEAVGDAVEVRRATTLSQAVHIAADLAKSGDGVLLSPACSSYDMFSSYKARGDAFVAAVREIVERRAQVPPSGEAGASNHG